MIEDATVKQEKSAEQFPLLKMVVEETGYKVASPKGWLRRTSDYAPACWLSLMLVMVSIMGVLALSASVNKRQSLLLKWFSDKHQDDHRIGEPPADVFFHKIVQDRPISFDGYSLYLSHMATKYPFLRFHIYFLIDDSRHDPPRHYDSMLIKKLFKTQVRPDFLKGAEGENLKVEVAEFSKTYKNVNVTIKPLSEHVWSMLQQNSPIKYIWRTIPKSTLQFYAGAQAVWKNGGIALDLDTFSDDFKFLRYGDQRIKTIFERYNEGLGVSKEDIDRKRCPRYGDFFSANFYSMFNSLRDLLFRNSTEVITVDVPQQIQEMEVPHVRTHRSKREAVLESVPMIKMLHKIKSLTPSSVTETAATKIDTNPASINTDATPSAIDIDATKANPHVDLKKTHHTIMKKLSKELLIPDSMIMFDITLDLDDDFMLPPLPWNTFTLPKRGPPFTGLPHVFAPPKSKTPVTPPTGNKLLVLDAEGRFMASSVRYHAFLGRLLFSWGMEHSTPRNIFESVLSNNCYGSFGDASTCGDVYFL